MNRKLDQIYDSITGVSVGILLILVLQLGTCIRLSAEPVKVGGARSATLNRSYGLPYQLRNNVRAESYKVAQEGTLPLIEKAKYRIGVIDTGYSPGIAPIDARICKTGNYDFYSETAVVAAVHPHGSMVAALVAEPLGKVDYCIVVFQVANRDGDITPTNVARAIMMASKQKLNAVNISLAGPQPIQLEQRALNELAKSGTKIFVAAGNDHLDLDHACQAYPACYEVNNMQAVGAMTADLKQPAHYSNYGTRVKLWYSGDFMNGSAAGTSFASPRAVGDYILSIASPLPK